MAVTMTRLQQERADRDRQAREALGLPVKYHSKYNQPFKGRPGRFISWFDTELSTRKDPPAGPKCAVCGKAKVYPKTRHIKRAVYEQDPFCSSRCARQYHGTQIPEMAA